MRGRNCCFMKKGEGKSLGVRMTTEGGSNLLGTREKGGTLEMLSPMQPLVQGLEFSSN